MVDPKEQANVLEELLKVAKDNNYVLSADRIFGLDLQGIPKDVLDNFFEKNNIKIRKKMFDKSLLDDDFDDIEDTITKSKDDILEDDTLYEDEDVKKNKNLGRLLRKVANLVLLIMIRLLPKHLQID